MLEMLGLDEDTVFEPTVTTITSPQPLWQPVARVVIAEKVGLDMDQLRRDMEDPDIEDMLQRNLALAQALQINGTPAFVIGDEIVRGAIDMRTLRQIVEQARANSS